MADAPLASKNLRWLDRIDRELSGEPSAVETGAKLWRPLADMRADDAGPWPDNWSEQWKRFEAAFKDRRSLLAENERLRAQLQTAIDALGHQIDEVLDAADVRVARDTSSTKSFARGGDEFHVLRILGNGQISAGKAAELLCEIFAGGKPELMPFEAGAEMAEGAHVRGRAGTPLENVMAAFDLLTQQVRPTAWMRGVTSYTGPNAPPEHDAEFVYGDDKPEGEGWVPLYRLQKMEPPEKTSEPHGFVGDGPNAC